MASQAICLKAPGHPFPEQTAIHPVSSGTQVPMNLGMVPLHQRLSKTRLPASPERKGTQGKDPHVLAGDMRPPSEHPEIWGARALLSLPLAHVEGLRRLATASWATGRTGWCQEGRSSPWQPSGG